VSLAHVRENWQRFAREDPLWAILAAADKKGGRWNLDEFLATGRAEIRRTLDEVKDLHLSLEPGRALDFGCGVGRLTHALAEHFAEVNGVDIAPAMVERARALHEGLGNCRFIVNERQDLSIFADATFDFVYSNITLQHMEPHHARAFVREFVRVLRPGGIMVFQLAGRPRSLRVWVVSRAMPAVLRRRYFRWRNNGGPYMEMHGADPGRVGAHLEACGARVVRVRADDAAGRDWTSFRYFAVRAAAAGSAAAPGSPRREEA